jgi:hypothetical protein
MCAQYYKIAEPTGLNDINDYPITDGAWLMADDQHYKQKAYHYVFWDEFILCWNTIKFCNGNEKLDYYDELFRVQHRKPEVCDRPSWISDERLSEKLKHRTNLTLPVTGEPGK